MLIKLDRGDTQEVFKEFVDTATRQYINTKIKQLFEERVDSIIKQTLGRMDVERLAKSVITEILFRYFKADWRGRSKYVDEQIMARLKEIDIDKLVNDKFSNEVMRRLWSRGRFIVREEDDD